eukprot:CAMPEP_0203975646 /NCGR_PEP_ID=MMETSP0359-20131031/100716_1 /ASSEMBLY_ACC=CAM_ASM_000338 /TAXON_ID=268821 /ORGANISM="Scrippsiella Hangoei, Strain SHTV-5" /LENGTH=927 /DNA_ID=CAMNT_0050913849 /DNA_START=75 /DNA_END=2858 /DNA_ORIENTATION=-
MSFMALATWLLFHAAMRAQVACVQLRTRKVRVPVPTQRQLDGSRKLLSTYEEQGLYDMFRIPFVMPNGANSPENSDEEEEQSSRQKGYAKGGIPGVAAKVKSIVTDAHEKGHTTIYGIVITVCVTVFVEGRSGLKFPGPPVFISQIYLQCLGVGMSFMALATWLLFHAAMRAQVACVQLRTRKVRVPVPTQRQLDGSRKLLSTYEEQGLYDMFRIPFVMPNGANSPENSDEEEDQSSKQKNYAKGGIPGIAAKVKSIVTEAHEKGHTTHNARMPGLTSGNPSWYEKELDEREECPESSPSGYGIKGAPEPFEHFELLRNAQKEWWACEAYMRICFLYGMMHLIMAFSYWITLHNVCELGMIWCSNLGAAGLTAGVWIMFRMDVLPEHGGAFPMEIGGPFVTSITLGMMYGHTVTQTMIDVARGIAAFIILMHIALCFRMYSIAKPAMNKAHHQAKEAGGRLFNQSGACDSPSWLPTAFQHVMYLVAPPKTNEQLEKEQKDRDNNAIGDDPLAKVDMTPWYYLRTMVSIVALGWVVQLTGHAIECVMGERMLMSNPGQPPWSRVGQWYGWEHGPVSSKHYAHVTPQRGHWAWQKGWGPQGQQELWASDMFGFAPEADMWWSEPEGPEPLQGAAGFGENTWSKGLIAYGQNEPKWGPKHPGNHDFDSSGGHRRLSSQVPAVETRAVVPVPVLWPGLFEPDHLTCGPEDTVAALTFNGMGAFVPAADNAAGHSAAFSLEGLAELGMVRGLSWAASKLLVVTTSGKIASCPLVGTGAQKATCSQLSVPPLPSSFGTAPATAIEVKTGAGLRAMVATGSQVALLELHADDEGLQWREAGSVFLPEDAQVAAVAATHDSLLATAKDGSAHLWHLRADGTAASEEAPHVDVPTFDSRRKWQSACLLPSGKIMRLASTWQRSKSGASTLSPELLI